MLEGLNCNSIHALEELRKSRTSNTSKEVFDFLTGDIQLDDQSVKRLGELNTLCPKESLKELSFTVKWLDAEGMKRIKELKKSFPVETL